MTNSSFVIFLKHAPYKLYNTFIDEGFETEAQASQRVIKGDYATCEKSIVKVSELENATFTITTGVRELDGKIHSLDMSADMMSVVKVLYSFCEKAELAMDDY